MSIPEQKAGHAAGTWVGWPEAPIAPDADCPFQITGLEPRARITISLSLTDAAQVTWQSSATFEADASGLVDTARQASIDGSYIGVDVSGLFWSLAPQGVKSEADIRAFLAAGYHPAHAAGRPASDGNAITYAVTATSASGAALSGTLQRLTRPQGCVPEPVDENGIKGMLCMPEGPGPHPGLILLSGSGGGCAPDLAAVYAAHGIATLALAYFAYPGLPPHMENIPLEYFATALDWFAARLGHRRIGLRGASKGAEAALLVASTFPDKVGAVLAFSPAHVVVAGTKPGGEHAPMWTYQGQALPAVFPRFPSDMLGWELIGPMTSGLTAEPFYRLGMTEHNTAEATIAVERIACPILLVVGSDDQAWPAVYACEQIAKRLHSRGWPHELLHLNYRGAGHLFPIPNTPMALSRYIWHPHLKGIHLMGGSPVMNAHAARASWFRSLDFLRRALAANTAPQQGA